jgi:hypothetical protein
MSRKLLAGLAIGVMMLGSVPAQADLIGTLTYMQPTGIVGPNDSVPVWMKYTLGEGSDQLTTDSNAGITSHSFLNGLDLYGGSLTVGINGFPNPPYDFVWGPGPGPTQDWDSFWNQFDNLSLINPGDSFTYASTTFFPSAGPVPAGLYTAAIGEFDVWGPDTHQRTDSDGNLVYDDSGNPVMDQTLHTIASADNAFSRTVVGAPTPEPSTYALMGLGGLIVALRLKKSRLLSAFSV